MRARSRGRLAPATLAAAALLLSVGPPAAGEVVQHGNLRVSFEGAIRPRTLPRHGLAPVAVSLGGRIATTDRSDPPPLRRIAIAINGVGRLDYAGLPTCTLEEIQPSTTANAQRACGAAKVGEGSFSASVAIPEQSPFPSQGKVIAYNGVEGGRPAILAHIYGTEPVPTSYTLPLRISRAGGSFGTLLTASLPKVTANIASVTAISLTLDRRFRYRGRSHGYLSAGCPAPEGFPGATFPLARVSFAFLGGRTLRSTLRRSCGARG